MLEHPTNIPQKNKWMVEKQNYADRSALHHHQREARVCCQKSLRRKFSKAIPKDQKSPSITFYIENEALISFVCGTVRIHLDVSGLTCPYSGKSVMLMHGGFKFSCIASHQCWNHDGTMLNATPVCRLAFSEHRIITRVNPSQCPKYEYTWAQSGPSCLASMFSCSPPTLGTHKATWTGHYLE